MKKKGFKDAENKMGRESGKQVFGIKKDYDNSGIGIVSVSCETDFVANTDIFKDLASSVLNTSLINKSGLDDTNTELVSLNYQSSPINNIKLSDALKTVIAKTGENCSVKLSQFIKLKPNIIAGYYLHGNTGFRDFGSQACIVYLGIRHSVNLINESTLRDLTNFGDALAMHCVAMNPRFISIESIPHNSLEREKDIIKERIFNEMENLNSKTGRKAISETVVAQRLEGALKKFYNETCLLEQDFVISTFEYYEPGMKVKDLLNKVAIKYSMDYLIVDSFDLFK